MSTQVVLDDSIVSGLMGNVFDHIMSVVTFVICRQYMFLSFSKSVI